MSHAITKGYKKRIEQILKEELGALSVSYLKMAAKEVLPSWTVAMGASMPNVKMERPLEGKEVNATY
jgi:hypothetical protein